MTTLEIPDDLWKRICALATEDGIEPLAWIETAMLADKKSREEGSAKRKPA